jgi:phage-related protein
MPTPCPGYLQLETLEVALSATPTITKRVLKAQYGDGYMERRTDGLNPWKTTWQMETPPLEDGRWQEVEQQLMAFGEKPFYWQPPGAPEKLAWVMEPVQWSRNYVENRATLRFTIETWNGPVPGAMVVPAPRIVMLDPDTITRPTQPKVYPAIGPMYPLPTGHFYPDPATKRYTINIIGYNFLPTATITVGNMPYPADYVSPTVLRFVIDAAAFSHGTTPIRVRVNGVDSNALMLNVST